MGRSESPGQVGAIRDSDLDILSLLKSAETIATEVVLDRLLERLVEVCAEAAGADRVVVVLEEDGEPFVRATGTAQGHVALERTALSGSTPLARGASSRRASRDSLSSSTRRSTTRGSPGIRTSRRGR